MADAKLDRLCVTTLRMLAVDMVQAAKSGHPGMPLGAAPGAYVIWDRFLKHNPANPKWADRDRFVLSAGHACAMLYSLLHLTGYDLPLDELKKFRQLGSKTPGHPEAGYTAGVEATTGPLGQGISSAVGMAIAERHHAALFNRPGHEVVNHRTFVMCSDGDLMEGISSEACSLAGFLGLGRLIALYDDNGISIEGRTHEMAFKEDVGARFESYGWRVLRVADMNDIDSIEKAFREALNDAGKPTLIWARSQIGFGSPEVGTAKIHGEPMKDDQAALTRQNYEWNCCPQFHVPAEAQAQYRKALDRGKAAEGEWTAKFAAYQKAFPELAAKYTQLLSGKLPAGWEKSLPVFPVTEEMATRDAGGKVMNAIAPAFEGYLVGGSADLAPSTKTLLTKYGHIGPGEFGGMNMHFGVREHAMGAVLNGMALHGGVIPFGATFMVFSDYMRGAVRVAAISHLPVIYVFTHDSIGVGEDGPTHQPVEHLAAFRCMPNMVVLRPGDPNETAQSWKIALERRNGPTILALTRQKTVTLDTAKVPVAEGVKRGAYILVEADGGKPDVILIASGSELGLALAAQPLLAKEGIKARVVSMPSMELFEQQDAAYREKVLPSGVTARIGIEAGVRFGWGSYLGAKGDGIFVDTFGASGTFKDVFKKFGFTVENVVAKAKAVAKK
jgi:transketolase